MNMISIDLYSLDMVLQSSWSKLPTVAVIVLYIALNFRHLLSCDTIDSDVTVLWDTINPNQGS